MSTSPLDQSYEDYLSDEPDQYGIPDGLSREEYEAYVKAHPSYYTVTTAIQSNDTTNPPAQVRWYSGTDHAAALAAMVSAAAQTDISIGPTGYRVLAVRIDIHR